MYGINGRRLNVGVQTLTNGNSVDLSSLAGGGGASSLAGLSDVDTSSAGHTPTNGQAFFGLILGQGIDAQEVSNGSVSTDKIVDDDPILGVPKVINTTTNLLWHSVKLNIKNLLGELHRQPTYQYLGPF